MTVASSPACAGLLQELRQLRERSARAREESAALGEAALWAGARTIATRDAMWHNRLQWQAWRDGWALWRQQSEDAEGLRPPRICIVCEAVSFTPPLHAADSAALGAHQTWVDVPVAIRERFRAQDAEHGLAPDICPRCVLGLDVDELDATGGAATEAWRQDVAQLLLEVFAEIDVIATETTASMPWLDTGEALDRTLADAIELLRARIPPVAMTAFIEAIHGLVQRLRGEQAPCGSPAGDTGHGSRGAPGRFRPFLLRD